MLGEDIEGVVNADEELDYEGNQRLVNDSFINKGVDFAIRLTLCSKVASNACDNTKKDASPRVEETRARRGSDESRNGTRAPADHGPLLGQTEVEDTPGGGGKHGGQARVPRCHDGTQVGAKGRAAVEAQPAEPEEDGAEGDEGDVVGAEVHHHLLVAAAEDPRVGEGGHARADLDGDAAGVVEHAVLEAPAVGVPDPVGEGAVDEGGPAKGEDHGGDDAATLGHGTDGEGRGDGAEHHLVERVQQGGDQRRADRGRAPDLHEAKVSKVADEGVVRGLAEGEGVAPEVPLEDDDAKGHHDDPEHGEGRLSAGETRVEEGDAGDHHEDETGAQEDIGLVTSLVPLVEILGV